MSSDEDIPCLEQSLKYCVEYCNTIGSGNKLIFKKIPIFSGYSRKILTNKMDMSPQKPRNDLSLSSNTCSGFKVSTKDLNSNKSIINERQSIDSKMCSPKLNGARRGICSKDIDKLNNDSITNLLCEFESSDNSESDECISKCERSKVDDINGRDCEREDNDKGNQTPFKQLESRYDVSVLSPCKSDRLAWLKRKSKRQRKCDNSTERNMTSSPSSKKNISVNGSPRKREKLSKDGDHNGSREGDLKDTGIMLHNSHKLLDDNQQTPCTPERNVYAFHSLRKITTPTTPSSRRGAAKKLNMTPVMPVCKRNFGTPKTPLQDAMTRLHVSAVPSSLPCREEEFENISYFLEGKLLDSVGGCMYISGVPGTGKTATVREVVRSLKQSVKKGSLPEFQFIEVNGMRLSHPRQAYVQIWKFITQEVVTAEQAQRLLEQKFTRSAKKKILPIVLLVDEVDVLWTRRQDVVYNLLDWPTKMKSQLIVVTIANTMDLPERLLMGRITSRLGLTRLTFQPYTHKQLEEIVKARLEGINAFDADAIQFVSRKVASLSGDARRALDICRRATEIAEQESPQCLVTIKHVDEALTSMTSSCTVQAIMNACSAMEQLFLQAVDAELTRTGMEETTFCKAYSTMETLCSLEGLPLPSPKNALNACMKLSSLRLLLSQHSHMGIYTRIFLNISVDDLHYALQEIKKINNKK